MSQHYWNALLLIVGSGLGTLGFAQPIVAQVVSDNTLPAGERSQVSGNPNFQIDGGVRRGGNLFHSFDQFSVPTGGSAFFNNAANVQNIFSRVTGGSASNIDGVIRANGTANLFLLNPNGILFGPNASLNIGGSFVATTATAIGFPNGDVFSSDATQPLPNQLLTINPNALFFNQIPQPIVNHSTFGGSGLQVPLRQNLLLVGGPVTLDDGRLASPGSYVDIAGIGGVGTIGLVTTVEDWQLTIPDSVARADVSLINDSRITLLADEGGSAAIAARNLTISDGSRIRVGIDGDSGFVGAQTGGIQIDATESVSLLNDATARIEVLPGGTGNVGDMTITTGTLVLDGNSRLIAAASGQGNVGRVIINARDRVSFNNSYVLGIVQKNAIGNTGGIAITTGTLTFAEGGGLDFSTRGQGNAGSVIINARDRVSFNNSSVFGVVTNTATGNTGGVAITTGTLALAGGAQLSFSTEGRGDAGSVTINARDRVSIDGENPTGNYASTIFTQVLSGGTGQGGDVTITTGSLFLTNGGAVNTANTGGTGNAGRVVINARDSVQIRGTAPIFTSNVSGVFTSATEGSMGNGGDVAITAGSLAVADQGRIVTNAEGQGNAGNIQIHARDIVSFDGGYVISTLDPGAIGRGGDIDITARSLSVLNGAQLATSTVGQGNAGNVIVNARDIVSLDGANRSSPSSISTRVESGAVGNGGRIDITTGSVSLTNGAQLATTTLGQGRAGDISIHARDRVAISGSDPNYANRVAPLPDQLSVTSAGPASGLFANTEPNSIGQGGNIGVTTGQLSVEDGAQLVANATGQGNAGNIQIRARGTVAFDGGDVISTLDPGAIGRGGNINITARSLSVIGGAQLSASTAADGNAGNIIVSADRVRLSNGQLLTTTSSSSRAGDIVVNTPDLQLRGATSGLFAGTTSAGDAGNLTIQPRENGQNVRVNLQSGAQISASTSSSGRGGRLTITAPESITLTGNGSIITAGTEGSGRGGDLALQTDTLNIQNRAEVTVSSVGTGRAGSLFVDANQIYLNHGSIRADTSGGGGNINLRSPLIVLRNGSNITTNATGRSIPGGNIAIGTRFLVAVPDENSDISANSEDFRGGNVSINAVEIFGIQPRLRLTPLSDITATGANSALGGTVDVITAGIDPTTGLVELPTNLVDSSQLITQGCLADQGNSLIVSGRGGLPPNPEQQLDDDAGWQDRRRLGVARPADQGRNVSRQRSVEWANIPNSTPNPPIVEATGFQVMPNGTIILVAAPSDPTVQNQLNPIAACSRR